VWLSDCQLHDRCGAAQAVLASAGAFNHSDASKQHHEMKRRQHSVMGFV